MTGSLEEPRGAEIVEAGELLLRQVCPAYVQEDRITSQVFKPKTSDAGLLSVHRRSLVESPAAACELALRKQVKTCGAVAVTVAEVGQAGLRSHDDPEDAPIPDPAHAVIDYRDRGSGAIETSAKRLRSFASARNWLHRL